MITELRMEVVDAAGEFNVQKLLGIEFGELAGLWYSELVKCLGEEERGGSGRVLSGFKLQRTSPACL